MHSKNHYKRPKKTKRQQLIVIVPIDIEQASELCNSFILVQKANGMVRICLDPAQLNRVLIRTIHRCPTLNNILPRLVSVQYLTLIDVSSGYPNVKLDKQTSYLTTFPCPFGTYRCIQLPVSVVSVEVMFQRKIDELFQGLSNVFGIVYDIIIAGFQDIGRDHDATLNKVLRICRQANSKLNKDKMPISVYKHTILCGGNVTIRGEPRSKISICTDSHDTT